MSNPRSDNRGRSSKGYSRKAGSRKRPEAPELADDPAIISNGWTLLQWPAFGKRWRALITEVERLRDKDPEGYKNHPATRFLALLSKKVFNDIPSGPGGKQFRQGKTMGSSFIHWRRAKFGGRFRLFFRYDTKAKVIIYAWLNEESTLRQAGGRSDVYAVFHGMLESGDPPTDWTALVAASEKLTRGSVDT